jgi:hypothetical protein
MLANRIGNFLPAEPGMATPAMSSAFVTCPCAVLMMSPAQQAFATEVYRLAYERTQAQLRPAVRPLRFAEFSLS